MKVLLVEDDDSIAEPLGDALAAHGIVVDRVATGAAALTAARPELVLLDLGLPDIDGLQVCRQLRRGSDDIAIIVMTARGQDDRTRALEMGADEFVSKPFRIGDLIECMRALRLRKAPPGTSSAG